MRFSTPDPDYFFFVENLKKYIVLLWHNRWKNNLNIQLIRTTNTNSEFLQRIFCLFTFWVFLQGKSFELISQYTQTCQYNSLHWKDKNPLQQLKFGIHKIGCSMSWTRYELGSVHKLRLQNLAFFDHLPPSVYIFYGIKVYKKSIFLTTYPPPLVNVVCERPLTLFSSQDFPTWFLFWPIWHDSEPCYGPT